MGDIQCGILKQETNRAFVIYRVVYWNRNETECVWYKFLCTETGKK